MIPTLGKRRHSASIYLRERWGLNFAPATMANLAVTGEGPIYRLVGKYAVYADEDLDSWAQSRITTPRRRASGDFIDRVAASDTANTNPNFSKVRGESVGTTTDSGLNVRDALEKACE
jgi:hypothetical protein